MQHFDEKIRQCDPYIVLTVDSGTGLLLFSGTVFPTLGGAKCMRFLVLVFFCETYQSRNLCSGPLNRWLACSMFYVCTL